MSLPSSVSNNFTKAMICLRDMVRICFRQVNWYSYEARYIYVKCSLHIASLTNKSMGKVRSWNDLKHLKCILGIHTVTHDLL